MSETSTFISEGADKPRSPGRKKPKEHAQDDDYESFEVSSGEAVPKSKIVTSEAGPVASGEINTKEEAVEVVREKRVTNKNVIRRTPKEKVVTLEAEPVVSKEIEEKPVPDELLKPPSHRRRESSSYKSGAELGAALATAGEKVESEKKKKIALEERNKQSLEKHRKAMERLDERNAKILAERGKLKENAGPGVSWEDFNKKAEAEIRQKAKESRDNEARTDYVEAYKKYDPKFTKNKSDDQIAKTKPPFFAFGKAVKELRRLHGVMLRAEDSRVGGLSPEARQAIAESGQWDEDVEAEKMKHAPENK